ncbi:MAG TPA: neutral/alkaline non-lysosomal ceramidase N-terminal domain-containing protein [Spirochaetia bacterium]|nr:neutral/alkaline non-lysosomal ceramidase N-terminal domain-containing protein [Spirochaetia bacterium]
MNSRMTAGVSLVDISPGPGIELAGYPHHPRHNKGIHDPLYAGCICLDDGTTRIALVCMDLLMYSKKEVHAVRQEIARRTAIPAANIMITCSHTHSGPWASGRLDLEALEQGLEPDPGFMADLRRKLVSLVTEAWENRFEATVGVEKGFCGREKGVGGNRRNPNEIADPEVWVVAVKDSAGKIRGCMVRYALHPTFLHSDSFLVSADYPGCIRKSLAESHPGTVMLFAQGCSGNQSPRYFRSGKTYDEALRVGYEIGREASRVLDTMEYASDARLMVRSTQVDIELRALPSVEEARQAVAVTRAHWEKVKSESTVERDIWNAELRFLGAEDLLGYVLVNDRGDALSLRQDELPVEVQVIGIGDSRIVALQGEIFVEFGVTIQYRAPFDKAFVIALANGCLPGYACTARAYAQGGYETGASLLTGRSGEQLVDAAVRLLRESAQP